MKLKLTMAIALLLLGSIAKPASAIIHPDEPSLEGVQEQSSPCTSMWIERRTWAPGRANAGPGEMQLRLTVGQVGNNYTIAKDKWPTRIESFATGFDKTFKWRSDGNSAHTMQRTRVPWANVWPLLPVRVTFQRSLLFLDGGVVCEVGQRVVEYYNGGSSSPPSDGGEASTDYAVPCTSSCSDSWVEDVYTLNMTGQTKVVVSVEDDIVVKCADSLNNTFTIQREVVHSARWRFRCNGTQEDENVSTPWRSIEIDTSETGTYFCNYSSPTNRKREFTAC